MPRSLSTFGRGTRRARSHELESQFVEALGYNERNVYAVSNTDKVLRFGRGTVVHIDTLDWTEGKQHHLEAQAQDALAKGLMAGRRYALANHLIEYYELPELGSGVVWQWYFAFELLEIGRNFRVLGNARNAFVRTPNDKGIETFEDLVCELLMSSYESASDLESFGRDMQEAGIVQKSITPGMLGDQTRSYALPVIS